MLAKSVAKDNLVQELSINNTLPTTINYVIDPAEIHIANVTSSAEWRKEYQLVENRLGELIYRKLQVFCSSVNTPSHLDVRLGIRRCFGMICRLAMTTAHNLTSCHWLWLIRRFSDEAWGPGDGINRLHRRRIAEALTAMSQRAPEPFPLDGNIIHYSVENNVLSLCSHLLAAATMLEQLQATLIEVNLGGTLMDGYPIPRVDLPKILRDALALMYSRGTNDDNPLPGLGTVLVPQWDVKDDTGLFALLGHDSEPQIRDLNGERIHRTIGELYRVRASYSPRHYLLRDLQHLFQPYLTRADAPVAIQAALALQVLVLGERLLIRQKDGILSCLTRGFFGARDEHFDTVYKDTWEEVSEQLTSAFPGVQFCKTYRTLRFAASQSRPHFLPTVAGPSVRLSTNGILVDMLAASDALHCYLVYPPDSTGPHQVRSDHFEFAVQALIDASPWKPSTELRAYRGKILKRGNDTPWSNIDAIGFKEGFVLLVSCKSRRWSPDMFMLSHKVWKDNNNKLINYHNEWQTKCQYLREHKSGRNYLFSPDVQMVGCTCVPQVPLLTDSLATAEVMLGLRAIVSYDELSLFLSR